MIPVFVALGANLGDRRGQLEAALGLLAREPGLLLSRVSSAYETEPVGPAQPRYVNAVAELRCVLTPQALVRKLLSFEEQLGRQRREKWGPREIDLDLLLYGDRRIDEPALAVPHPGLPERSFVLVPLAEIAPGVLHPALHLTAAELLSLRPQGERAGVRRIGALRPQEEPAEPEAE